MTVTPASFLAAVLPDTGPYIACVATRKGDEVVFPATRFDTLEALLSWAQDRSNAGGSVYFTPGAFRSRQSLRRAGEVQGLRDLYADIDTKETHPPPQADERIEDLARRQAKLDEALVEYERVYPTRKAAAEAVLSAVQALALPEPYIVSSGGGLHVHWPLSEALALADWRPLAARLRDALLGQGLVFDSNLTTNPVCLLRPPGTVNYKLGADRGRAVAVINRAPVAPVGVAWLRNHLDTLPAVAAGSSSPTAFLDGPAPDTSGLDIDPDALTDLVKRVEVDSATVYQHCASMRWCRDNPTAVREPLWFAGLRVLAYCSDGRAAAHAFSEGHPDYSPEETDSYLDRIQHPGICSRLREQRPEGCKGCPGEHLGSAPHFAASWSARIVALPEVAGIKLLPVRQLRASEWEDNTFERRQGHWYRKAYRDAAGNQVPQQRIMRASLLPVGLMEGRSDNAFLSAVLMRDIHPISGPTHFEVPADSIYSKPRDFQSLMANRHHLLDTKELAGAQRIMKHWHNRLLQANRITYVSSRLGWDGRKGGDQVRWDDAGQEKVFRMPEYTISKGEVEESMFRPKAAGVQPTAFAPIGTLDAWREVYKQFVGREKALLGLLTLTSFASPLMSLMGSEAAIVVASDPVGGTGKTAAIRMAASAYSHPGDSRGVVLGGNVSTYAIGIHCATLGDLPAYINELDITTKHTGTAAMASTIYSIVNGSGMTRGRADGTTTTTEAWNLLLTITTNANLTGELIAMKGISQARLQRLLVITPKRTTALRGGVSVENERVLASNHGLAGRIYLEGLLRNQHLLPSAARQALTFTGEEFGFVYRPDERIRWHTVAALVLGYRLARSMGLCPLEEADVMSALRQVVSENRDETRAAAELKSAPNALAEFLNERRRSIVRYGESPTQMIDSPFDLIDPLVGRYDKGANTLILTERGLSGLALELNLSVSTFLGQLRDAGYTESVRRSTYTIRSGAPSLTLKGYKFNYAMLDAIIGGRGDLAREGESDGQKE